MSLDSMDDVMLVDTTPDAQHRPEEDHVPLATAHFSRRAQEAKEAEASSSRALHVDEIEQRHSSHGLRPG